MKYRKSRYTPDFKVRVLAALDAGSKPRWRQVEKEFDVPQSTLVDWYRRREQIMEEAREAQEVTHSGRIAIDAHFDMLTQQLINSLPAKIESAKLTDSIRALTMLKDLHQVFHQDEENKDAAIERLMKQLDRYRRMKAERGEIELSSTSAQEE